MVRNVVAVQALGPGLKIGRGVAVTNPESIQVRDRLPRLTKGELPIELQSVGRGRNARVLRSHGRKTLGRIYAIGRDSVAARGAQIWPSEGFRLVSHVVFDFLRAKTEAFRFTQAVAAAIVGRALCLKLGWCKQPTAFGGLTTPH